MSDRCRTRGIGFFMDMIVFDQVTYSYPGETVPVLKDFSLKIARGEEVALIGGNGCGKTTVGLLLCGILKPQAGEIRVNGRWPGEESEEPIVGFLFQDPENGLVATTVEREVAFSLENRNMTPERMRSIVNRTIEKFGLSGFRERLVWRLSGGEKQRLSLAALFAAGPKILFLDEPASFLDYAGSRMLDKALKMGRQLDPSITLIRVTQYPETAQGHERVILIHAGSVRLDGSPENVFSRPDIMQEAGLRSPLEYLKPKRQAPAAVVEKKAPGENHMLARTESLYFKYDINESAYVIANNNLTICAGRVLALTGPSGCGKSTLAQLICGIYEPLSGRVVFERAGMRAVMSFQQPERQFFLDTVFDEVAFGPRKNYSDPDRLVETARTSLDESGLFYDRFKDRDPHSLSGGEARRLAFAVTLALEGDLIIFDEPTCGLDEGGTRLFKRMICRLKSAGKAIMVITHNSDLIGDVADRVALMMDGRIEANVETLDFFLSADVKGVLSIPSVMRYQQEKYGEVTTCRTEDIFELLQVCS